MQVSSAAILFLCYFAIFTHDPVPNDSNELRILSRTDVTDTAETSVVKKKVGTIVQISNIFDSFAYCSNLTVIYAYGQGGMDQL